MRVAPSDIELAARKKALRAAIRARRKAVPRLERAAAARQVALNVDRAFHLHAGQRVAIYASYGAELSTTPLIELARGRGCQVYLPRILPRTGRMRFIEAIEGGREKVNRIGIVEPQGARHIAPRWLDLVLLPLVGFDEHGVRLGMGGGYYDRAFAFRNLHAHWRGPRLVGVAYSFQQLPSIIPAAHDVRMDAVVTEKGVVRCRTGS